jgi:hypothetical protein
MPPFMMLLPAITDIIDRILPDKDAALKAKAQLDMLQQQGELQLILGQLDINKAEAQSNSPFVAGWRPFIGWVCGFALAYEYLIMPFLSWICLNTGLQQPPHLVMDGMMELVMAMLGMAGLRTFEKTKGVAR